MTPEEQQRARLAATPEAAAAVTQNGLTSMATINLTDDELAQKVDATMSGLESAGVDTSQTYRMPDNSPVAPNTLQEAGIRPAQFSPPPTGMGGP